MKITKCFCFDIHTGSYIIASLGVIRGLFYLTCLWFMFGLDNFEENVENFLIEFDSDKVPIYAPYVVYCISAGAILFTINYFILLLGLVKKEKVFLQIWLLFEGAINSVSKKNLFDLSIIFFSTLAFIREC